MFYKTTDFKFLDALESNWLLIKEELNRLQQNHFTPWHEKFLYNKGWEVFGLYAFEKKLEGNCHLCPETAELVESIPGMTTAGFSCLAPGTHILPHIGYSKAVLRSHLGLIVPDNCGIRVGNQTLNWQEGKCLIFDDTVEHEAWNKSNFPRIVLLIDFKNTNVVNSFEERYLSEITQI
ncbi:aspartyl/asparaginyl beta-hydroxylase domain-containing protein [aff. Roholtiella sp. LEGE 12411]|uniref:aspartyl/asparaginyl beta-hydroxylase domain-containing protein n=1 Tax=aff. Roholtiella sp. LEGE 12411 TaxID=1828822 RepID=UPI00187ED505|nr:aspartyl/asparaginyl beta-hydroxylase domain-containing protein [aff. Roholtiella sp. LEGE 12411]MBE9035706.1 aspartyl/asparaginyl beta-hydroxylase domain-containing protein [aff. Roholtiella sp. LEGE 12411]